MIQQWQVHPLKTIHCSYERFQSLILLARQYLCKQLLFLKRYARARDYSVYIYHWQCTIQLYASSGSRMRKKKKKIKNSSTWENLQPNRSYIYLTHLKIENYDIYAARELQRLLNRRVCCRPFFFARFSSIPQAADALRYCIMHSHYRDTRRVVYSDGYIARAKNHPV